MYHLYAEQCSLFDERFGWQNKNIHQISDITNCESGKFHIWEFDKPGFTCKLCKNKINELKYNKDNIDKLTKKYNYIQYETIANKYCFTDGKPHQFVTDEKTNKRTCKKCNKSERDTYNHQELDKLIKNTNQINLKSITERLEQTNKKDINVNEDLKYKEKLLEKLTEKTDDICGESNDGRSELERSIKMPSLGSIEETSITSHKTPPISASA